MATQVNAHQRSAEADLEPSTVAATIARVATRLFAERGFDATSIREIAEAAGVTKPALYYHFGSKQGLGEAILTRPLTDLAEELARLAASDLGDRDPVQLLEAIFQAHLDFVAANPDRSRFVLAVCFGPIDTGFRAEIGRSGKSFHQSMLGAVGRLAAAGVIPPDRVAACAEFCRRLMLTSTMDHVFHCEAIADDLAGQLVHDLLNGFARPAGSFRGTTNKE